MKLHELHVGQLRARAMRDCISITCSDLRIRGVAIDLPASAGSEHGCISDDLDGLTRDRPADSMTDTAFHDEVENASLLENLDPFALANPVDESPRNFGTRLIAMRMNDSPA